MGIYAIKGKKGKIWYIDYTADGKRVRRAIGPSKRMAQETLLKEKTETLRYKNLGYRKYPKIIFKDMAQMYYDLYSKIHKKAPDKDKYLIRNLNRTFGNRYSATITLLQIEEFKVQRLKEISPSSLNTELKLLRHIFKKAVEWNKVAQNPLASIKLLREPRGRIRFLSKEELKRLLEVSKEPLKSMVSLAVATGLRKSNLIYLKWNEVDLARRMLNIEDTKSGEPLRMPLNNTALKILGLQPRYGEFVFSAKDGSPHGNPAKAFKTTLKRADIKDFRWHDLRHTFVSYLVMSGTDLRTIMELGGWKTLSMVMRYAHLAPEHKRAAIESLDSYLP